MTFQFLKFLLYSSRQLSDSYQERSVYAICIKQIDIKADSTKDQTIALTRRPEDQTIIVDHAVVLSI